MMNTVMSMGSDLFEPGNTFEEEAEAEQAGEQEQGGEHEWRYGRYGARTAQATSVPRSAGTSRNPCGCSAYCHGARKWEAGGTLPKWKGGLRKWEEY